MQDDDEGPLRFRREIEGEIEALGDPEISPPLPSGTLAAQSIDRRALSALRPGEAPLEGVSREILKLAWPVMASQVLMNMTGLIDRMMIGRLAHEGGAAIPLAAVGYATQFFFLIQSTLFAVGLACVALMARAIGAGRVDRARDALTASLQVSVAVTTVTMVLLLSAARPVLSSMGAEPEVIDETVPYMNLLVGSSILLAVSLVLDSALRANRDMRTPMLISMVVTAVKLGANWLLIFGGFGLPKLGLLGAGTATAISQIVGLALFVAVFARQGRESPLSVPAASLLRSNPLTREVIRIAVPGIAERIVMNVAMLAYFWVLSRYYGTVTIAAYTVGLALLSFSWIPGMGYAQACATLVGQSLGASQEGRATRTGLRAAALAVGTAIPLGLLCAWQREALARLFTDDLEVIAALGPFMLTLALAQPFLQLHFTLGGAHRGAGDTTTPLLAATVGNWVFRVPLAIVFAGWLEWDVTWVWIALIFDHMARAAWLGISFQRGHWRQATTASA